MSLGLFILAAVLLGFDSDGLLLLPLLVGIIAAGVCWARTGFGFIEDDGVEWGVLTVSSVAEGWWAWTMGALAIGVCEEAVTWE